MNLQTETERKIYELSLDSGLSEAEVVDKAVTAWAILRAVLWTAGPATRGAIGKESS